MIFTGAQFTAPQRGVLVTPEREKKESSNGYDETGNTVSSLVERVHVGTVKLRFSLQTQQRG